MKIYGSETLRPRHRTDICEPDVADIMCNGLNTSAGGRDYFKHRRHQKAQSRRILARLARRAARDEIEHEFYIFIDEGDEREDHSYE